MQRHLLEPATKSSVPNRTFQSCLCVCGFIVIVFVVIVAISIIIVITGIQYSKALSNDNVIQSHSIVHMQFLSPLQQLRNQ